MDIPLPPNITEEQINKCRETGDYCPVLFEWYKYVSQLAFFYANIQLDSPAVKDIPKIHHSVVIGLLNRCSKLMFSNVAQSHEGLFGESTSIIDRSIFESAIKLSWLCQKNNRELFDRFIAEGLKTEIEFRKNIKGNIDARNGEMLVIEERMLRSIDNYIAKSGLTESYISESKKLPNLAQMIDDVGHERLAYIVGQKIGSHHVHGTWVSLWFQYLEEEEGVIRPRGHDVSTHVNQYAYISLVVLDAISEYVKYICEDEEDVKGMSSLLEGVADEILKLYQEAVGSDGDVV
ncbi:DUF5677 domain-containing protein [Pseudomonadota bacterium]